MESGSIISITGVGLTKLNKSYVGKPTGWEKETSQTKRRKTVLDSRNGSYKRSAEAMLHKFRITSNNESRRKLWADYLYFKNKERSNGKK